MEIYQTIRILVLAMISFLVALAITPSIANLLYRFKAGKQIRGDIKYFSELHQKKEGTPTMGGIIIWGTTIGLALIIWLLAYFFDGLWGYLNFIDRAQTYLPLAALFMAAVIGLIDDAFGVLKIGPSGGGLTMRHRLIVYTFLAALGAYWFYYRLEWSELMIPFIGMVNIGWFYIPYFMFVIVASAFSANETDGLDGLAGGVLLFAFAALTVVAFVLGRYDLAAFSGVIIGALLAFLWFNIYPAKFFMGDTGSMSLGITMGVIAMLTNTSLFLPLFALILVIESLSVIIQVISFRFFGGKRIFLITPLHHHFEALKWHETTITMRFWIISAVFVALGLALFFLNRYF
jgi:phospho-N-acetylmuramoyl-pentapeptide-transferase